MATMRSVRLRLPIALLTSVGRLAQEWEVGQDEAVRRMLAAFLAPTEPTAVGRQEQGAEWVQERLVAIEARLDGTEAIDSIEQMRDRLDKVETDLPGLVAASEVRLAPTPAPSAKQEPLVAPQADLGLAHGSSPQGKGGRQRYARRPGQGLPVEPAHRIGGKDMIDMDWAGAKDEQDGR